MLLRQSARTSNIRTAKDHEPFLSYLPSFLTFFVHEYHLLSSQTSLPLFALTHSPPPPLRHCLSLAFSTFSTHRIYFSSSLLALAPHLRSTQPSIRPLLCSSASRPIRHFTMTAEMHWSPDFCLACDRQSSSGAYCSQACRLADIEKAGSEPVSPTSSAPPASWASSGLGTGSGFYLPPAVNFAAYKPSSMGHSSTTFRSPATSTAQPCYFSNPNPKSQSTSPSSLTSPSKRSLTPSSSRTSLSSIQTTSTQEGQLSDQARSELRGYASSFDQVRDWKRRMTTT